MDKNVKRIIQFVLYFMRMYSIIMAICLTTCLVEYTFYYDEYRDDGSGKVTMWTAPIIVTYGVDNIAIGIWISMAVAAASHILLVRHFKR